MFSYRWTHVGLNGAMQLISNPPCRPFVSTACWVLTVVVGSKWNMGCVTFICMFIIEIQQNLPQYILLIYIHPRNLTWNPKMKVWRMFFLFKWVIFRFHVSFLGCTCFFSVLLAGHRVRYCWTGIHLVNILSGEALLFGLGLLPQKKTI